METLQLLWGRSKYILRNNDVVELIKRVIIQFLHFFYWHEQFYVYRHIVPEKYINEDKYKPNIENFEYKYIHSRNDADKLISQGYKIRLIDGFDLRKLDKGAIAFCAFIDKEIVNIGWVARDEESKKSLTNIPFNVAFDKQETYSGGIETGGRYRGRGIHSYAIIKRERYFQENNIKAFNYFIAVRNTITQKAVEKYGAKKCSQVDYLKILFWQRWNGFQQ